MSRWQTSQILLALVVALSTILLPGDAVAVSIRVDIDTSVLSGTAAELVFDFLNGDATADNSVTISNIITDGLLASNTPDSIVVGDLNANGHIDVVLAIFYGNTVSVIFPEFAGGTPDRFSMSLLDETGTRSLVTTDLPGNALLDVDIVGPPQGISLSVSGTTIPNSPAVTVSVTPVPEPATWLLLGSGLVGLVLWRRRQRVWLAVMVGLVSLNLGVAWAITIDIDEFQHATVLLPFAPHEGTLFLCENSSVPLSPVTCEAPRSDTVVFLSDITTGSALLESDLPEPGTPAAPGDRSLLIPFPAPFFSVGEPGGENTTQTLVYTPTIGQPGFALVQGTPVSYAITSDVVPEPSTWLLLGTGLAGIMLWRWRQPVVNSK